MNLEQKLVGIRIMQKRKEKGLSQEELSEMINLSKNHLSSIERGKYIPTTRCLIKICNALGGTPDYYLIGKISDSDKNEIVSLLNKCPEKYLDLIKKTINLFIDEINKD